MKSTGTVALAALVIAALMSSPMTSHAFGLSGVGGKLGLVEPENRDGTAALGAHLEFEQPGSAWHLVPGVMYWNEGGVTSLSANADMYYHFRPEGLTTPYLGAGVGLNRFDFEGSGGTNTEAGINLFGGVRFPASTSHLFIEGRYTASDISQTALLGGVTFNLPR